MIGVDALFATFNELGSEKYSTETSLIISIGHTCCHVIPMLKGKVIFEEIKRVNVGSFSSFENLYKQMNLKHSHHKHYLDYTTV